MFKANAEEISIRRAERTDFESIFPLLEQLWNDRVLDKNRYEQIFLNELSNSRAFMFCASGGKEIIGFIAGSISENFYHAGNFAYISTLITDGPHRGKHIGTRLLDTAVEHARQNGCLSVELDANFHRSASHEFYEHYGFRKRAFTFTMGI